MSIFDDFHQDSNIWKYSNPSIVREKYNRMYKNYIDLIKKHYNIDSTVYPSSRRDKKYMLCGILPDGNIGMIQDLSLRK